MTGTANVYLWRVRGAWRRGRRPGGGVRVWLVRQHKSGAQAGCLWLPPGAMRPLLWARSGPLPSAADAVLAGARVANGAKHSEVSRFRVCRWGRCAVLVQAHKPPGPVCPALGHTE